MPASFKSVIAMQASQLILELAGEGPQGEHQGYKTYHETPKREQESHTKIYPRISEKLRTQKVPHTTTANSVQLCYKTW